MNKPKTIFIISLILMLSGIGLVIYANAEKMNLLSQIIPRSTTETAEEADFLNMMNYFMFAGFGLCLSGIGLIIYVLPKGEGGERIYV